MNCAVAAGTFRGFIDPGDHPELDDSEPLWPSWNSTVPIPHWNVAVDCVIGTFCCHVDCVIGTFWCCLWHHVIVLLPHCSWGSKWGGEVSFFSHSLCSFAFNSQSFEKFGHSQRRMWKWHVDSDNDDDQAPLVTAVNVKRWVTTIQDWQNNLLQKRGSATSFILKCNGHIHKRIAHLEFWSAKDIF